MDWDPTPVGLAIMVICLVFIWSNRPGALRRRAEAKAKKLVGFAKSIFETPYQRRTVRPAEFPHQDIAFYDRTRDLILQQGFQFLGDYENVTLNNHSRRMHRPIFTRAFASIDGMIAAEVFELRYHLRQWFRWLRSGRNIRRIKSVDFQTEFGDGTFLLTTDNVLAPVFRKYPEITRIICPPETPPEHMLEFHRAQIGRRMAATPGLYVVPMRSLDDLHASSDRLTAISAAHRKSDGYVTRVDIERVAGRNQEDAAILLGDAVERLKEDEGGKNQ